MAKTQSNILIIIESFLSNCARLLRGLTVALLAKTSFRPFAMILGAKVKAGAECAALPSISYGRLVQAGLGCLVRTIRPTGSGIVDCDRRRSGGKVEMRLPCDFSAVSKARLQRGIEALLAAIDKDL